MDQTIPTKKYPTSTAEVSQMLGLPVSEHALPMGSFVSGSDLPVANLPVAAESHDTSSNQSNIPVAGHPASSEATGKIDLKPLDEKLADQPSYVKISKALLPYAAVFTVGLFLYYFFFSSLNLNLNLSGIFNTKNSRVATASQTSALMQLQQQDLSGYQAWISGFYYDVKDPKVIDPNTDNSGNGLTNFQKYLLNLNPKSYDTLGIGMSDSQAIAQGVSPVSGEKLTANQIAIIAKYIDMEAVMNRLALYNLQNPSRVAGANTNLTVSPRGQSQNIAFDGAVTSNQDSQNLPQINTAIPAQLSIPDLKINVPIIWSADAANFETDLQSGVVHYPGTAMPGEIGTTYIAGHSSNYAWAKGAYNQIFSHLGDLPDNASFQIIATTIEGKQIVFHYVFVKSGQYSPTDEAQFLNTGKSLVALSTCWPVGSTAKRLVLYGQLMQVDK